MDLGADDTIWKQPGTPCTSYRKKIRTETLASPSRQKAFQITHMRTAVVVTTDEDVFDLEVVHSVLQAGHAVQVLVAHQVAHIALHKHLSRSHVEQLRWLHAFTHTFTTITQVGQGRYVMGLDSMVYVFPGFLCMILLPVLSSSATTHPQDLVRREPEPI